MSAKKRFTTWKTKPCEWKDSEGRVLPGEHGTTTQYARALRVGAEPCQPCKDANTAKDLAYRRARKEKGKPADHVAAQRAKASKPAPQSKPTGRARKVG